MVCDKVVCERWCVTKWWEDGVSKMVGDKLVCEGWCLKDGVCVKDGG